MNPVTIDLTGIATSIIAGVFAVLGIVIPLIINARIKDAQAATVLNTAVKNSLGALEQAATTTVTTLHPAIKDVPAALTPGVQYVLDHAGAEAARFGITPASIAEKVDAQLGLAKIASTTVTPIPAPVPGLVPVIPLVPATPGPRPAV